MFGLHLDWHSKDRKSVRHVGHREASEENGAGGKMTIGGCKGILQGVHESWVIIKFIAIKYEP